MFQWLRKLLRLPEEQPCNLFPEETLIPEPIEIAPYRGQDPELSEAVGRALAGVLDVTKVSKQLNFNVIYEDGTAQLLLQKDGKYRVYIDDHNGDVVIRIHEVYVEEAPKSHFGGLVAESGTCDFTKPDFIRPEVK